MSVKCDLPHYCISLFGPVQLEGKRNWPKEKMTFVLLFFMSGFLHVAAVQDSQHTLVVDSRQEKKQQNRLIESATKLSFNFICKLRITEVT